MLSQNTYCEANLHIYQTYNKLIYTSVHCIYRHKWILNIQLNTVIDMLTNTHFVRVRVQYIHFPEDDVVTMLESNLDPSIQTLISPAPRQYPPFSILCM